MGSLSLMCPMCCGEYFDNSESLKNHLLNITNNLSCPGCSLKTYSMATLIHHLDCCRGELDLNVKVKNPENINNFDSIMSNNENENIQIVNINDNDLDPVNENFIINVNHESMTVIETPNIDKDRTIQVDENGDILVIEKKISENRTNFSNKTSKKTKKKNQISNQTKNKPIEELSEFSEFSNNDFDKLNNFKESETMYSCSSCHMNFVSVMDHVKQYHDGQEVLLDIEDTKHEDLESNSFPCTVEAVPVGVCNKHKKKRLSKNTLRTEECIDSDGRFYTRKVVQIEKFWDQLSTSQSTEKPMIEKFFSNVKGLKVKSKNVKTASARQYKCDQCLMQFNKLNELRIHECSQGNCQCECCNQTFATNKALKMHCAKVHYGINLQNIFSCTICSTEFSSHKSLALHARMHAPVKARHVNAPEGMNEETFDCEECGKTLSESYREAHMILHSGDNITCKICNRKFDSDESLKMHAAVHIESSRVNTISAHSSDVHEFSAPILSKTIQETEFLRVDTSPNQDMISDTSATAAIEISPKSSLTKESIQLQNLKPYQCQHCGRGFSRPHEKVKHERIHTGEKPHSCEVCGKKFRVSYCLTLHMRTHTGERPYECQHCGKRFKASSVYNHHLLTHGDERAYCCPYCPKTFKTRVQLAGHKNSHTKPFKCTKCSRPFASLYAARAHMQTHKKDNNLKFTCSTCGATYGRAFALKDHIKLHQKEGNLLSAIESSREEDVTEVENFTLTEEVVDEELIIPDDLYPKFEKTDSVKFG